MPSIMACLLLGYIYLVDRSWYYIRIVIVYLSLDYCEQQDRMELDVSQLLCALDVWVITAHVIGSRNSVPVKTYASMGLIFDSKYISQPKTQAFVEFYYSLSIYFSLSLPNLKWYQSNCTRTIY